MKTVETVEFGGSRRPGEERNAAAAVVKGARRRCPCCGEGRLFRAYLKVAEHCPRCGEELFHHRADDAPAYFTIVIVGHIVVAGALALEKTMHPESWVHMLLWLPLTVILSLVLLPVVKGALVGLQWGLGMHGFGAGAPDPALPEPIPEAPAAEGGTPPGR